MWKTTTDIFMLIGIIAFAGGRVNTSCPLELNPPSVVVRYGDTVSVNCSTPSIEHDGMGWESEIGATEMEENVKFVTWTVESLKLWKIEPQCYINPRGNGDQCTQTLAVTLYKEPDSVSISQASHTGPMVEGMTYQLQCDIINIAPVRNLTVIWFKEQHKAIHRQSYDNLTSVTPVNESSTLTITPGRDDDGTQVYCETQMNLGPSGPNPFPSQPHIMTVHYPPTFLSSETETLDPGDKITLNCTATGNPTPSYSWQCSNAKQEKMGDLSVITTTLFPGTCNCTASNGVGAETKQFIINLPEPEVNRNRTTFWAMVGPPVAIALLAMIGYVYYKTKKGQNSII